MIILGYSVSVNFTDPLGFTYDVTEVSISAKGTQLKKGVDQANVISVNLVDIEGGSTILEFTERAEKSAGSEIRYQITADQKYWYYHLYHSPR